MIPPLIYGTFMITWLLNSIRITNSYNIQYKSIIQKLLVRSEYVRFNNELSNELNIWKVSLRDYSKYIDHDDLITEWKRIQIPIVACLHETVKTKVSCVIIPKGSSIPLHNQEGDIVNKVIYGSIRKRNLLLIGISEFSDENYSMNKNSVKFSYEDAFAGSDDCVCRGGRCPRREGCIFWVQKKLRDNGSFFTIKDNGFIYITYDSEPDIVPHSNLPQEYDAVDDMVVFISVLLKDESLETQLTYDYHYYRSDRILPVRYDQYNMGQLYRIVPSDQPLGPSPIFVTYNIDL